MEDFAFGIPSDPHDLLGDDAQWKVTEFFDTSKASPNKILAAIERLASVSVDPITIVDEFDIAFSLAKGFGALKAETKNTVLKCFCQIALTLQDVAFEYAQNEDERKALCAIKMQAYLLHIIITTQEDSAIPATAADKKGKSKSSSSSSSSSWFWTDRRPECVEAFASLLTPKVKQQWPMKSAEAEYINIFTKTCYKLMESTVVLKDKAMCNTMYGLLGVTVQHFNQSFNVSTSILHMLGHFEHLPVPLAALVQTLVTQYDGQNVVNELMREIGRNDPKEFAQDAAGTRNIAAFLVDLGDRIPMSIVKSAGISVLLPHLDGECYPIRNAILAVLTSIVCNIVCTNNQSESASKLRKQFQEILEERFHDVSAYVRSKVLQLWATMASVQVEDTTATEAETETETETETRYRSAIPRTRLPVIVALAAQRLKDKSAIVRKDAIRLVSVLLRSNPYGPELKLSKWKADYKSHCEQLAALRKKHGFASVDDDATNANDADEMEDDKENQPKAEANTDDEDVDLLEDDNEEEEEEDKENRQEQRSRSKTPSSQNEKPRELQLLELTVIFFKDATFFAQQMEDVIPRACDLLGSSSTSDIKESVAFLEACQLFKFEGAQAGIRKMLALVWSKEDSIKAALIDTYQRLYLSQERSEVVAKNLVSLTEGCNLGELTSLEELLHCLQQGGLIPSYVVSTLWSMFAMKGNATREQSVRALIILGMMAQADPKIVKDNSGKLISIGFGERGSQDMELVRYTCKALQVLVPQKGGDASITKFDAEDDLFARMMGVVCKNVSEKTGGWCSAAEEVVNTFYLLAENPDQLSERMLKSLSENVVDQSSSIALTRLVSSIGHVALKQLVHLEKIEVELKRRSRVQEDREQKQKQKQKQAGDDGDDIIGGAAAVDNIAEDIAAISENCLVIGNNLLAKYAPLLVGICKRPSVFPDVSLRTAAVLSLSKFMCISSSFAEEHLQLLFTILQEAPEPAIRANCILAVGDLAFRFANLLEPWTRHMYSRLHDDHVMVRKNAVMVLTHLILNDMIKIKGQISEMAKRLEDPDERVASLCKLFFQEIARKGNAIYNMLPDVISQLAAPDSGLVEGQFERITSYLFNFITKGVHTVSLVEKLCYRFRTTQDVVQWRYFAHCLSMLQYNDKAIKKLQTQISCFQDTLYDSEIYQSFVSIVAKAKKFASADMKDAVAEFEEKLAEIHEKGAENDEISQKADKASQQVKSKNKKGLQGSSRKSSAPKSSTSSTRSTRGGGRSRRKQEESSEDESEPDLLVDDDDDDDDEGGDDDANEEEEEEEENTRSKRAPLGSIENKRSRPTAATKRRQARVLDDDSSDGECMI